VAIEIADAEGLQALSMARLAERLGCATMSLYRHVASKEELQVFMMDRAPGDPPTFAETGRAWRRGLERWARALLAVYHRHPWILEIGAGRPPLEPGQLVWLDSGLRVLRGTPLRAQEKIPVILLVLSYVRGVAQIRTGVLKSHKQTRREEREQQAWYGRTLTRLVEPGRFPALAEIIAAGAFGPSASDASADFTFGLARLLDGIETYLVRRPKARAARARRG
jgi:AcrR family transcriptional regulator